MDCYIFSLCAVSVQCASICLSTYICVCVCAGTKGISSYYIIFCLCRHISGPPAQLTLQQCGCKTLQSKLNPLTTQIFCFCANKPQPHLQLPPISVFCFISTKIPVHSFSKCTKDYLQNTLSFTIIQPLTQSLGFVCLFFGGEGGMTGGKCLSFP